MVSTGNVLQPPLLPMRMAITDWLEIYNYGDEIVELGGLVVRQLQQPFQMDFPKH